MAGQDLQRRRIHCNTCWGLEENQRERERERKRKKITRPDPKRFVKKSSGGKSLRNKELWRLWIRAAAAASDRPAPRALLSCQEEKRSRVAIELGVDTGRDELFWPTSPDRFFFVCSFVIGAQTNGLFSVTTVDNDLGHFSSDTIIFLLFFLSVAIFIPLFCLLIFSFHPFPEP
jgi:hypothetical protein